MAFWRGRVEVQRLRTATERYPKVRRLSTGFSRRRVVLFLTAFLVTLLFGISAEAGPFKNGFYADSRAHTFLTPTSGYPAIQAAINDWKPWVDESRATDLDPTVIYTETVTYHYNSALTYPYVDVSWLVLDLSLPGSAACNVVYSGFVCDHWHVSLDSSITANATQEFVACQELAHTLGLDHSNDSDTVADHESCLANDEDSYISHAGGHPAGGGLPALGLHHIVDHDRSHINAGY